MAKMLDAALYYAEKLHWSVIPCGPDKKPFIKWEKYQKELASVEQIREWWSKWPDANIAVITGSISGVCVIDVDEPIGHEELQKFIPDSIITPTVKTPRDGQHLYFKYPDKEIRNNARLIPGCDFRGEAGYCLCPPSANGNGKHYAWVDDLKITQVEPAPLPDQYIKHVSNIYNNYRINFKHEVGEKTTLQNATDTTKRYISFTQGQRDEDLFHTANCLVKGNMSKTNARKVIEILSRNCNPPFPEDEIEDKITSAMDRLGRREGSLAQEVKDLITLHESYINTTDIQQTLQVTTFDEKKNLTVILTRLCHDKVIEHHPTKRGYYRPIMQDMEIVDFRSADQNEFPIAYPFDIHKLIKTYRGNISVVAGAANSGKTSFMLNLVAMNMFTHRVNYISSEMGASELRIRLEKFENVPFKDWQFNAYERSGNFADVVRPSEKSTIWIIDYLEMLEDFWKVGLYIKQIHDKLIGSNDIAVIAIQKAPGLDTARGGAFSMEKPRLNLAMEYGKIKITKAKNWRTEKNPNGLYKEFKLVGGCNIIEDTEWFYDEDNTLFQRRK